MLYELPLGLGAGATAAILLAPGALRITAGAQVEPGAATVVVGVGAALFFLFLASTLAADLLAHESTRQMGVVTALVAAPVALWLLLGTVGFALGSGPVGLRVVFWVAVALEVVAVAQPILSE
jgi:hypothetical protein